MHSFIWPTYFSFLAESNYWQHIGLSELKYKLNKPLIKGEAKNVIMFLGDGMSLTTITSARIYKGQKKSNAATDPIGEKAHLAFENFPFTGLAKVRYWLCSIGWNYQNIDLKCKVTIGQGPLSTNWPSSHEYDTVVNKLLHVGDHGFDSGWWHGICHCAWITGCLVREISSFVLYLFLYLSINKCNSDQCQNVLSIRVAF